MIEKITKFLRGLPPSGIFFLTMPTGGDILKVRLDIRIIKMSAYYGYFPHLIIVLSIYFLYKMITVK